MKKSLFLFLLLPLATLYSCKEPVVEVKNTLTVSPDTLTFYIEGGKDTFAITTNVSEWTINSSATWVNTSVNFGVAKQKDIIVTVEGNTANTARNAVLTIAGEGADTVFVQIKQIVKPTTADLYPSYSNPIAADQTGMTSDAKMLAKQMYMGWNLGNTLEVPGGETGWGNPKATQLLIDSVKAAGFNAVRLPCAWNSYIENTTTCKIKESWLARVKEVIDYCYKNNMYVILNIHWDGGWLENNVTTTKQSVNNAKQKAIWEQIAMYLRDYDEHLMFAGANEPNVDNATQMGVLLTYHQTFVDAVRGTGGRNAYRTLVVQGPSTDITKTSQLMSKMPTDNVSNRMMAEVHFYTPWNFCGMDKDETWGSMFYYWGSGYHSTTDTGRNATWGEESEVNRLFGLMKTKFADKGIPVIMGEFGALKRSTLTGDNLTKHLASRAYFYEYVFKQAKNNGLVPFLWDTGIHGNNDMGIIVRSSGAIGDRQAYNAIKNGAAAGNYPF